MFQMRPKEWVQYLVSVLVCTLLPFGQLLAKNDVRVMKNEAGQWVLLAKNPEAVQSQLMSMAQAFPDFPDNPLPRPCCYFSGYCQTEISPVIPSHVLDILGKRSIIDGPNCFNAALYARKILPTIGYFPETGLKHVLNESELCQEVRGEPRPGDIGYAVDLGGLYTHAFTYVTDKLIFQKLDLNIDSEYEFKGIESIAHFKDSEKFTLTYYRCDDLPSHLKENPLIARNFSEVLGTWEEMQEQTCAVPLTNISYEQLAKDVEKVTATLVGYDVDFISKMIEERLPHFIDRYSDIFETIDERRESAPEGPKKKALNLAMIFAYVGSHQTSETLNFLRDIVSDHRNKKGYDFSALDKKESESPGDVRNYLADSQVMAEVKNLSLKHYQARKEVLERDNEFGKLNSQSVPVCHEETRKTHQNFAPFFDHKVPGSMTDDRNNIKKALVDMEREKQALKTVPTGAKHNVAREAQKIYYEEALTRIKKSTSAYCEKLKQWKTFKLNLEKRNRKLPPEYTEASILEVEKSLEQCTTARTFMSTMN